MSENALARAKEEIATLRAKATVVRQKADKVAKSVQRDATQVVAAHLMGRYESDQRSRGQAGVSLMGLDAATTVAVVAYGASHFIDGEAAELAHDIAVGVGCGIAYKKGLDSTSTRAAGTPAGP